MYFKNVHGRPGWMAIEFPRPGQGFIHHTLIPVRPHYSKLHKTKLHMDARTRYAFFVTDKKQSAIRIDRFSEHQSNETLEKCAGYRKVQRLGERVGDIDDLWHIPTLPRPAHTDQPHRPGGGGEAGPCVARPGTFYHLKSVSKPDYDHLRPGRSGTPRRSSEEFHADGRSKFQLCYQVSCKTPILSVGKRMKEGEIIPSRVATHSLHLIALLQGAVSCAWPQSS